jgi:hypothetical protein
VVLVWQVPALSGAAPVVTAECQRFLKAVIRDLSEENQPVKAEPLVPHSFRAVSGPVIRCSRGKVEAITAKDAASPPSTIR